MNKERRFEYQEVPLIKGILDYVKKYGPVNMADIWQGGRNTGWISPQATENEVRTSVDRLLESGELIYTNSFRLKACPSVEK